MLKNGTLLKVKPVYSDYPKQSRIFKGYIGRTFDELEAFASMFQFKIVDRYWSFDKEEGNHLPVIEVY